MPIAITPRRRSRNEADSDESGSVSPDTRSSSNRKSISNKRARLNHGSMPASTNATPLTNGYHVQTNGLQRESLRSDRTRKNHQPGSIVRVKLANFVTYTAVEFFPGPSLNMVIGPNGTGKSTLVCAVCLGLGWGPQHLGRAKEVSEFVKHGCQEATIEIELANDGKRFKKNIVIQCTIKREGNKTAYSVDGRSQGKKAIVELCRSLSIQIDNLCQFLPQDKVVEFAAMTPVELLRSTQRAVASQEMIDTHEQLKDLGKKQKDVQARSTADQETLTNLENRQRLQEADVERMREREQVENRVTMLEAARPFAAYRGARTRHREAKEKRRAAQEELTRLKNEVEPSLRALNAKEHYRKEIEVAVGQRKNEVSTAEKHADGIDQKFRDLQDKHNELVSEHNAETASGRSAKQDIARYELNIANLRRQMEDRPIEFDPQAYNQRIREKQRTIESLKNQIREAKGEQEKNSRKGRANNVEIQRAQQDMENLDSQAGKQNIKLQNASRETAKLWEWLQQHQDQFEKPVYGPVMVECSIKDPRYVDQIESLFQKSVMLSFTTQTKSDFEKLSDAAASLHLSEVYLKTLLISLDYFKAPISEDDMRRFGFEGFAIDHINGPEPVLAMLCSEAHLHQTGIAFQDTTPQQYDMLQNSPIQSWVTSKSTYRITRRREYGPSATSTMVRNIRPGQVWTDQPVDFAAKRELQEKIHGLSDEVAAIKAANTESQKQIESHRETINQLTSDEQAISAEKTAKQKAISEFNALPTKLSAFEEKMGTAQKAIAEVRDRLRAITSKQDEIAMDRGKFAIVYANAVEALRVSHYSLNEAEIMLIEASSDCEILTKRNKSVKELLETQEVEVTALSRETQTIHAEAQRLLATCTQLLSGNNDDDELKNFFKSLPEGQTAEELEAEIESEKARLELMHEGNGGVIREYESRKKKIDALTARLEEIQAALSELDETIKRLRDQWEPELDNLVQKISQSFSNNMEEISCAGEVGVYKDDDYDQWAIQIRVKFRENEPLTTLDSHRQSGGERAVSTIFYLMSLQTLTKSPFRVVDEINQGMDPRNERLVHKRMVGIACGNNGASALAPSNGVLTDDERHEGDDDDGDTVKGSQYFLITPKLLHNLTYERGMRVLCIASGEYMPPDRSRVDFKGCLDLMKGLRAGGLGVAAA